MEDITSRPSLPSPLARTLSSLKPHFPNGLSSYIGLTKSNLPTISESPTQILPQYIHLGAKSSLPVVLEREAVQQGLASARGLWKGKSQTLTDSL